MRSECRRAEGARPGDWNPVRRLARSPCPAPLLRGRSRWRFCGAAGRRPGRSARAQRQPPVPRRRARLAQDAWVSVLAVGFESGGREVASLGPGLSGVAEETPCAPRLSAGTLAPALAPCVTAFSVTAVASRCGAGTPERVRPCSLFQECVELRARPGALRATLRCGVRAEEWSGPLREVEAGLSVEAPHVLSLFDVGPSPGCGRSRASPENGAGSNLSPGARSPKGGREALVRRPQCLRLTAYW